MRPISASFKPHHPVCVAYTQGLSNRRRSVSRKCSGSPMAIRDSRSTPMVKCSSESGQSTSHQPSPMPRARPIPVSAMVLRQVGILQPDEVKLAGRRELTAAHLHARAGIRTSARMRRSRRT